MPKLKLKSPISKKERYPLGKVHLANSKHMPCLGDETIDLVVTSPPYFDTIDYSKHIRDPL